MANIQPPIKNWSITEASNQPDGSDSATIAGDLRAIQAGVRYLRSNDTIASASTCDLGSKDAEYLSISGTTTITALGTVSAGIVKRVVFEGALTLTHNGTSLILPGAANITTAAGDAAEFVSLGGGNWRCTQYQLASGGPVVLANDSVTFAKIQNIATSRILGRSTAGSGDIEELTIGAGLSLAGGQLSSPGVQILPISASVAANALTISASALSLDFRSTTLGSGTVTTVTGTPANLVISSGSTLGTVSATQSDIVVLAINNSGTIELAAVNLAGGTQLDETNLISTTAEGGAGAADSSNVVYSTTARTNVAYRVLGIVRSTQTTAGTWATAPSLIQGAGGNALQAMSSIGYGQTWSDVKASRAYGTTYYNTTGKPIVVAVSNSNATALNDFLEAFVAGVSIIYTVSQTATFINNLTFIVPPGMSYRVTNASAGTISRWTELR